jgi:hypothetical protein
MIRCSAKTVRQEPQNAVNFRDYRLRGLVDFQIFRAHAPTGKAKGGALPYAPEPSLSPSPSPSPAVKVHCARAVARR